MKNGKSKYSRRTSVSIRRSEKIAIIITVTLLIVIAAVTAVVTGNLLGRKVKALDIDKKEEYSAPIPEQEIECGDVEDVKACFYDYLDTAASYTRRGIYDFSLCLRSEKGYVGYDSPVAEKLGVDDFDKSVDLEENIRYIKNVGGYACGYFFVSSHTFADENIRRIMQAYEISLICEAVEAGAEDILLLGIVPDASNIEYLCAFVSDIKKAVGDRADVGVALDCSSVLQNDKNLFFAGKIGKECDFLGLDLHSFVYSTEKNEDETETSRQIYDSDTGAIYAKDPHELLSYMRYYIKGYSMRIIFDFEDSAGIDAAESLGFTDYQTVK